MKAVPWAGFSSPPSPTADWPPESSDWSPVRELWWKRGYIGENMVM